MAKLKQGYTLTGEEKAEIKQYAKTLYTALDSEGNKKYTLKAIVDGVKLRFDRILTRQTILNWSRKGEWDELIKQAFQHGVSQTSEAEEEEQEIENKIIKAQAVKIKDATELWNSIGDVLGKEFNARVKDGGLAELKIKELIDALEKATDIQLKLYGLTGKNKIDITFSSKGLDFKNFSDEELKAMIAGGESE